MRPGPDGVRHQAGREQKARHERVESNGHLLTSPPPTRAPLNAALLDRDRFGKRLTVAVGQRAGVEFVNAIDDRRFRRQLACGLDERRDPRLEQNVQNPDSPQ